MSKFEQINRGRQIAENVRNQGLRVSRGSLENMKSIRDILNEVPEDADDEIQSGRVSVNEIARGKAADVVFGEGGDLMAQADSAAKEAAAAGEAQAEKAGKGRSIFERIALLRFGKGEAADGVARAGLRAAEYRDAADSIRAEAEEGWKEYEELTRDFDGLPADGMGRIGTTPEVHATFLNELRDFDAVPYNQPRLESIPADRIEGVSVSQREMENPELFWGHHSNSREKYTEMMSHIPEIRSRLNSGESLDDIRSGASDSMRACATYCFGEERVKVWKSEGYYSFDGDGRHRVLMARQLGYDLPVKVMGEMRRKR